MFVATKVRLPRQKFCQTDTCGISRQRYAQTNPFVSLYRSFSFSQKRPLLTIVSRITSLNVWRHAVQHTLTHTHTHTHTCTQALACMHTHRHKMFDFISKSWRSLQKGSTVHSSSSYWDMTCNIIPGREAVIFDVSLLSGISGPAVIWFPFPISSPVLLDFELDD